MRILRSVKRRGFDVGLPGTSVFCGRTRGSRRRGFPMALSRWSGERTGRAGGFGRAGDVGRIERAGKRGSTACPGRDFVSTQAVAHSSDCLRSDWSDVGWWRRYAVVILGFV
jgi:hypothetical protein